VASTEINQPEKPKTKVCGMKEIYSLKKIVELLEIHGEIYVFGDGKKPIKITFADVN